MQLKRTEFLMNTRILLADDQKAIRDILTTLIGRQPGMDVVAVAENGRDAVKLARELRPDVVVMDINMPVLNGIDATRLIVNEFPDIKVLGLSIYSDCPFVEGMFEAGAAGYLLKDQVYEELIRAIRSVVADRIYICPDIHCEVTKDCALTL